MSDEITLDTNNKSLKLPYIVEFKREDETTSFDYSVVVEDGCIRIIPKDSRVRITSIYPVAGYDSVEEKETAKRKKTFVNLSADMISDSDNFDYFAEVDEFSNGASVIPDGDDSSFITASVDESLNLASEVHEETVDECIVNESSDEKENIEEKSSEQCEDDDCIKTESLSDESKVSIIDRFQKGEISILEDNGDPDGTLERLQELDSDTATDRYEYYYDPESDSVVYYRIEKE